MRSILFNSTIMLSLAFIAGCGGGGGGGGGSSSGGTPTPVNRAPIVSSANPDTVATTGQSFTYDATRAGAVFSDADGDTLTYSAVLSSAAFGLTASGGTISGTPSQTGALTVTVTATDTSSASVSDVFTITISDAPVASNKPNILFIISDDQGQDSSAQYALSSDLPNTPVLNGLADDGLIFDNAWVNPVCTPTRGGLITGKYGHRTDVLSVGDPLPSGEITLQSYMKNDPATSDYKSAIIGKWHLGGGRTGPNTAGVEHFAGILSGGVSDYYSWPLNVNGTNSTSTNYATTELTDQAIDWIGDQTDPWFVWLSYNAPHTPFHVPPAGLHNRTLSGARADINANPRPYYLAAIEAMDSEIGRLLNSLPADERANTVIVYLGDNGTPGRVGDASVFPNGVKGSLTEGGVRVPMFVSGPGVTRTGERESALINNTDMFTTIAQLAGSSVAELHDSRSFINLLSAPSTDTRDFIYSESGNAFAVRGPRYKLVQTAAGAQTLFDLQSDPQENSDLIASGADVSAILAPLQAEADRIRMAQVPAGDDVQTGKDRVLAPNASGALSVVLEAGESVMWSQTAGTPVNLSSTSAAAPTFTVPNVSASETLTFAASVGGETGEMSVFVYIPPVYDTGKTVVGNFTDQSEWSCDQSAGTASATFSDSGSSKSISGNGIPDHAVGTFPNGGNPNTISTQSINYNIPASPVKTTTATDMATFGVLLNGVKLERDTAERYMGTGGGTWSYEAITPGFEEGNSKGDDTQRPVRNNWLGSDCNNSHVQPNGQYHAHGLPEAYFQALRKETPSGMVLAGYAADGFPIYLRYGHSTASDSASAIKVIEHSWVLKSGTRADGPGGAYDGTFREDWEYSAGSGDTDECGGRTGPTPEFPGGTYHYYITDDYPYIPRCVFGTPGSDFRVFGGAR